MQSVILREILKISKNQSAVYDCILYHSKQFLNQNRHKIALKVYHKSSCITCKKGIKEIERISADIEKRDFFNDPFSESELTKIFKMSEKKPSECLRKRDKMYKELKFEETKKTESQIIKLMVKHPGLIQRPIIISRNNAYFGKLNKENIR